MRATAPRGNDPNTHWVTDSIELVAPIAEGAMGSVWVAFHHRLQTRVAVKFVSEKLGEHTHEALLRFEREATTASQIKSQHVVQVMDSGVSNSGAPYIVMELLDGESLGQRLRRDAPMSLREAGQVIHQVARALTKAHELGIVHRDIKPDNIFLCRSDQAPLLPAGAEPAPFHCKVLDFGIAKQTRLPAMGGLTTEGKMVGTPEYMSPEQVLEDTEVTYRADLWALAVVMYTALTAELPFKGKTLGQLCINLLSRKPPPPSQLRPELGAEVDAWFERSLHRDPKRRFGSAGEMATSFLELQPGQRGAVSAGDPRVSRSSEDTERNFGSASDMLAPEERRRPSTLAAALVAAVALGGVGVLVAQGDASVSQPLAPAMAQAAAAVVIKAQAGMEHIVPSTTIDIDDVDVTDGDPKPGTKPRPVAKPSGNQTSSAAAATPVETSQPAAAGDKSNRRGKAQLGF